MTHQPLVSVIIPCFNTGHFLPEAVESVLGQTYPAVEIIVVDDGSTDGSSQTMAPYGGRVRTLRQPNRGPAAARNHGIAAAGGELLAFLDADDIWLPEKLSRQIACLAENPRAGLVHTEIFYLENGTCLAGRDKPRHLLTGRCYQRLFQGNDIIASTVLVRRKCLEKVGVFDEAIRRASTEDFDLWLRIARHYELAFVPEPLAHYRQHQANASKNGATMLENELYVIEKNLRNDPALADRLGGDQIRERLYDLNIALGNYYSDQGKMIEANFAFGRALKAVDLSPPLVKTRPKFNRFGAKLRKIA